MSIRSVATIVRIQEDRKLVMQLPPDVPVGTHHVVAFLDDAPAEAPGVVASEWSFPVLANAQWPADMPWTRSEMYGDDGR